MMAPSCGKHQTEEIKDHSWHNTACHSASCSERLVKFRQYVVLDAGPSLALGRITPHYHVAYHFLLSNDYGC